MKNREQLWSAVEEQLTPSRLAHTKGVVQTAVTLAKQFGADPEKAEQAAILHDYSKGWSMDTLREWIVSRQIGEDLLQQEPAMWHAFVGAEAVREQLGVDDDDVLNAIRYHTTGRPNMSLVEKVVCLADYIEPGRDFPGVVDVRELAKQNLNRALLQSLNNTLLYLLRTNRSIDPLTVQTRNDLLAYT